LLADLPHYWLGLVLDMQALPLHTSKHIFTGEGPLSFLRTHYTCMMRAIQCVSVLYSLSVCVCQLLTQCVSVSVSYSLSVTGTLMYTKCVHQWQC